MREDEYSSEDDAPAIDYLNGLKAEFDILRVPPGGNQIAQISRGGSYRRSGPETPNALTVMVSHGRTGLGRWIMGSVADRVVRQSRSLVLVVKARDEAGI